MSDFVQFGLGETLKMKEIKNWRPSAPLTLYTKWIGVNYRSNGYIKDYCDQNVTLCKDPPNEITAYLTQRNATSYNQKQLRILLTRFALLNRSGNSTHKTDLFVNTNVLFQDAAARE